MEKTYSPHMEAEIYQRWIDNKYFHAEVDESKKPYTIMMPPANITGQLHVGHALTFSIQDILIRAKRMQGYSALWLPGTDHASISTEVKLVDALAAEGLTKADVGREKFLERAWKWREDFGGIIVRQLKRIGVSCDWDRERFTMDDGLSQAVLEAFIHLYGKGWIYRGEKLINWCPKCKTTISDAEVEHEDMEGILYYFKYPIDGGGFISFATTRPETILGDTAVAVNPKDERYAALVGKTIAMPIVGRRIPIIADNYVEKDFGTGVVKITPAHDPNDFEVGERHGLARINILNDDGSMNSNAGIFEGLDRLECRKRITEEFKKQGLFIKTEPITHAVGTHDRCHEAMEPMIKLQWFVKMDELAKGAIDVYKTEKLKIFPERYGKIYMHWLENIRDWCISRQLWWGHRIPAYYCQGCGRISVELKMPDSCPECGCASFKQDEDSLDTWFSSALWPFSTLGWPQRTKELEYFYPTDVLVTGNEILFFWVIRMVFSGLEMAGDVPFHDVMLHGIVRDADFRKMSKSLGNGVDPIEVINTYGADALRLMLVTGNALDSDTRFYWERLESSRNFLNKIWNASRFLLMNFDIDSFDEAPDLTVIDRWIVSKANFLIKDVTSRIDAYDIGSAAQAAYDFVWDEFCDWYIEMVKPRLYAKDDPTRPAALWTLRSVLISALKLLHPFIPFVTEWIFLAVQDKEETIMTSAWPIWDKALDFPEEESEVDRMKEAVRAIRNARREMNVPPAKRVKIILVSADEKAREFFGGTKKTFAMLSGASEVLIQSSKEGVGEDAVSLVIRDAVLYMPLEELIDARKEMERLNKERKRFESEVERAQKKLSNEGFISKAPPEIVAEERAKVSRYKDMLKRIDEQIQRLE
ncbi:MAG: valine--tRNA ligase [Clostridiales bacterium]|jgi:valyl-tRNA synthetase|nr:valine--tRNA ligase [Clostridiales bacterium]